MKTNTFPKFDWIVPRNESLATEELRLKKARLKFIPGAPPPPSWLYPPSSPYEEECRRQAVENHRMFWGLK
jgi:hypothetical protein